ncbi:MAG: hypothetical protein ACI4EN_01425 [Butyrivibrio sp.]
MTGEKVFEGEIIRTRGSGDCLGIRISVLGEINISDFKEDIIITGEDGFRGYPSEELFIRLEKIIQQGYAIEGEITGTKKEGICNALFCAHK